MATRAGCSTRSAQSPKLEVHGPAYVCKDSSALRMHHHQVQGARKNQLLLDVHIPFASPLQAASGCYRSLHTLQADLSLQPMIKKQEVYQSAL